MFATVKNLLSLGLILVAALVLSGCNQSTARYTVKTYSLGNVLAEYTASSLAVDGNSVATLTVAEGGRTALVNGTYATRRIDDTTASAQPLVYNATLYSGGKAVETFSASGYKAYRDRVTLHINNSERAVFSGTYVVHHIGANVQGTPDSARYKVTLVSDGVTVGTWFADNYSMTNGGLTLQINGISQALTIGGQYSIDQIR